MSYRVHNNTYAIIPQGRKTKVLERNKIKYMNETPVELLEENCRMSGSTLEGRQKGSAYLIGTTYKPPVIIDELSNLIFIPTHSIRNKDCIWINLNAILTYEELPKNKVEIIFINNKTMILDLSYNKFDKQLLRATKLERVLRNKKFTQFNA